MMSTCLKEIEAQCWYQEPCDFDMKTGGLSTIHTKFDRKKFADLIVKEMLALTYDEETRYYNLSEDYFARAMENFRELAKDHFGVQ